MQTIDIVKIIVGYVIPLVLGGIIGFLKGAKKKDKAIEQGLVALLRNELVRCYREYETKGEISILDKENMEDMFEQYEALGGNGTVKQLMTEVLNLKTKIVK